MSRPSKALALVELSAVIAATDCWPLASGAEITAELMVGMACSVSDPADPTNQA